MSTLKGQGPTDDVAGPAASEARLEGEDEAAPDEAQSPGFLDFELLEPVADAPDEVRELAAACVRFVTARYGVPIDFEPETLSLVDQYVADSRAEVTVRPEAIDVLQGTLGAYLGEVMRRHFGGTWFCLGEHSGWRVNFRHVYLTTNPIGMVREALLREPQEGWHAHLQTDPQDRAFLADRLATLPEVREDEYYAPTTRYDVVSIAHDALVGRMETTSRGHLVFEDRDYKS